MEPQTALAVAGACAIAKPVVLSGVRMLEDLFGGAMKVAGGMLADQVYAWQLGNRVRIGARTREILDAGGVQPKAVVGDFLLPFVEAAGNVSSDEMRELWARLLASAATDEKHQHPAFIATLRQMNREDAELFKGACDGELHTRPVLKYLIFPQASDPLERPAARLITIGLLGGGEYDDDPHAPLRRHAIHVTGFGWQFAAAVLGLSPPPPFRALYPPRPPRRQPGVIEDL